MQSVLYVAHGSRLVAATKEIYSFLEKVKEKVPAPIQEISFLEFSNMTIDKGIETCIMKGATSIAVVPVLLLTANHVKKDIPEEINLLQAKYPHIRFNVGRPIGVHENMIEIIIEHIYKQIPILTNDVCFLFISRGSSDQQQINEFLQIGALLKHRLKDYPIKICFLAAAKPSFEKGLQFAISSRRKKIIVIPYLLFTGILIKKIQQELHEIKLNNQQILMCPYLGNHPKIVDIIVERTMEIMYSNN